MGIGEVLAAKFLRSELKEASKAYAKIKAAAAQAIWRFNLRLVRLPYPETPLFVPKPDETSPAAFKKLLDTYGIKSLGAAPQAGRAGKVRNGQPRGQGFGL